MSWIDNLKSKAGLGKKLPKPTEAWIECKNCQEQVYEIDVQNIGHLCPKCFFHFRISPKERIQLLLNPDSFEEFDALLESGDPLKFKDTKKYKDRIKGAIKDNETRDAIVCGTGSLESHRVEICVFNFKFMGGSMGSVVGEKITRAIERAILNKTPLIIVNCSGGARMQEGILSLMQMAKTTSALQKLSQHGLPFISILTDPTTGGVSASFAFLGDVILAEPGALIGFAGPRVIEQTIKQKLPDGFQRSEFLLEHGLIDQVVDRREMRQTLNQIISLLMDTRGEAKNQTPETQETA